MRTRPASVGTRWSAPRRRGRRRARSRSAAVAATPVSIRTPWLRHSSISQSVRPASRSRPGPTAALRRAPPACSSRSTTRTRWPRPDSTRAHSRPAGPAPTTRTSPGIPSEPSVGGSFGLVPAAGLAHAAHDGVAVVPHPTGLVAEDARPGPRRIAGPHQPDQSGLGDLGPGHLDEVADAVVGGGLRPTGSTTLPWSTTSARPEAACRMCRHRSRLKPAWVWASGR